MTIVFVIAVDVPVSFATTKLSTPSAIISLMAVWRRQYITTVGGSLVRSAINNKRWRGRGLQRGSPLPRLPEN